MTLIPVATLRVWEQRYQAVRPATKASGHRLYDMADIQRVLLLRQLTKQGHAISSLAPLPTEQLQALTRQHAGIALETQLQNKKRAEALRLVVVGQALAERLRRPAVSQYSGGVVDVVAEFATLAEAVQATRVARRRQHLGRVDALIWQSPGLQSSAPTELEAVRAAWAASQVAVVYRFAGAAARKVFSETGALLFRDQLDDRELGVALASLASHISRRPEPTRSGRSKAPEEGSASRLAVSAVPRRFDDAALTAIAALPSTSACECPRHVAELLMQIANFESYSADCAQRNQKDSELHNYLHQVTGVARQLFESAIEAVARHEGLSLR
jgi:DNA-binding transcriptional MerR regulator